MKPILVHGVWTLLATGAYFAGTLPRHSDSQNAGSSRSISSVSSAVSQDTPGRGSKNSRVGAKDGAVVPWLDSFRNTNGTISSDRMKEAVAESMRDPDPVKSMLNFAALLNELTPENAAAALQAVTDNASGPDPGRFLSLLAHAWGEMDGKAALAAFDGLRRRESEVAKGTALAAWAARDPDSAMQWLQERNARKDPKADPRQEASLSRGMITGLARRDVDGALKYLMTLNEGQQGDFVGLLVEQKLKEGVASAAEWTEQLPGERMRVTGMEVAGGQYLRRDLEGATKWAEKIAGRSDAHEAVADIANEMAGRNPQQAAAWVAGLPAGASQNHAFEDVFENWTGKDPLAASQSLSAMTPGPGRDAAIQAFSGTLARENPVDALTWAGSISDPQQRTELQLNLARRWYANAPNDAQPWIAANLPAELQGRALSPAKR